MKRFIFATIGVFALATAAIAGDAFSTGDSYGPGMPHPFTTASPEGHHGYPSVENLQNRNRRAARQSYNRLIEAGGCNAPVVPYEYAVDCGPGEDTRATKYKHIFGGSQNGQMGSEGGD